MKHVPLRMKAIANYGLRIIASLLLPILISGCGQPSAQDLWQDYQMRLSNVFSQDIEETSLNNLTWPKLPSKRHLQQTLTPPDISLWQLIKLYDCEINTLVAKRNGPMGKVMPPSQVYIYTRRFVPQAKTCIAQVEMDEETQAALSQAASYYQSHERQYRQNALFHDEWQKSHHALSSWPVAQGFPASGVQTLDYFASLSKDQINIDASRLEDQLKRLAQGRLPGNWLAQLVLANAWLGTLNDAMYDADTLCPTGRSTPQSRIMMNVFRKYFAQQVQPWISQLKRFGESYQSQLARASESHDAMTDFYNQVFTANDSPWSQFNKRWRNHVKAWQDHLGQCRAMPKSTQDIQGT